MPKKSVKINNETVEGESLEFEALREDWNVYKLADGTTLRMKLVITEVLRVDKFNPATGEPVYQILSQNIVRADVPDRLKKESLA